MLSRTQVINDALRLIAANQITDPNQDTESARQARGVYDRVVLCELEAHPWFFAKAQAVLPENATAPAFKFARAFNVPSDFCRLVEIEDRWVFETVRGVDPAPEPIYEMQGRAILTNLSAPLRITYVKDVVSDPTVWTALFSRVVSCALAVELAMPLTKSEGMVSLAEKHYQKAIRAAKQSNAIQKPPQNVPDGSWLTARVY